MLLEISKEHLKAKDLQRSWLFSIYWVFQGECSLTPFESLHVVIEAGRAPVVVEVSMG